jgi:rhamnose utilization protein RhaD (predicted bifunctional aldolase and dehydrogenase)/NAD(P)-dependent dehydrogenase (short-subunit alcohol dehydrogenase family)
MRSAWVDQDARRCVDHYGAAGVNPDLALRVYSSRLLGRDPKLVLHGGGNTSVKTSGRDLLGETIEVIHVKGSGWDMAEIEPAGLPAVRLAPLRKTRDLATLADEEMVAILRSNLVDPAAPTPSVETLLHAFLPHKFIDHTHSSAVLSIANQPEGEAICRQVYGERAALVPYVMPGFALSIRAAQVYQAQPQVEGLILLHHGIFTFGQTAQESYERMIALVSLAEERRPAGKTQVFVAADLAPAAPIAAVAQIAPIVRGACSVPDPTVQGAYRRMVLDFRTSPIILQYVSGRELARYSQSGPATPDHTIRTKNRPLIAPLVQLPLAISFAEELRAAVQRYAAEYQAYFARQNARQKTSKRQLDPMPRVVLIPGLGLFGLGHNARDARIAADIAESTVQTITDAEAIGRFESLPEDDLFDVEYWSLEQAKLGKNVPKPLEGQIAVITGGGGTIGAATGKLFADNGAEVALLDLDEPAAQAAARRIGGAAMAVQCDVTDGASVAAAFEAVTARFGGVDIAISNAGAAWQGRIGEVDEAILRRSFEINFFAHQKIAQAAVRLMLAQGTGGALLFNVSKQAVNPGADFGPYGLPKAATLFLVRQYALDYGRDGIRANAVNADRVRSGLLTPQMIAARSAARGMSEQDYMAGNLLMREVTAQDVAQAFLHHALALKTTADVTTVDGGNIAAALR